jgi:hypothetical protein
VAHPPPGAHHGSRCWGVEALDNKQASAFNDQTPPSPYILIQPHQSSDLFLQPELDEEVIEKQSQKGDQGEICPKITREEKEEALAKHIDENHFCDIKGPVSTNFVRLSAKRHFRAV